MALKRMGIVKDYEKIREKTVAVVGVGGNHHLFIYLSYTWTSMQQENKLIGELSEKGNKCGKPHGEE